MRMMKHPAYRIAHHASPLHLYTERVARSGDAPKYPALVEQLILFRDPKLAKVAPMPIGGDSGALVYEKCPQSDAVVGVGIIQGSSNVHTRRDPLFVATPLPAVAAWLDDVLPAQGYARWKFITEY